MKIEVKAFNELDAPQLFEVLKLRTAIFVVEQECAYQEVDDHDKQAWHLMGKAADELVAYARVLPANTVYTQPSIGRVLVKENYRRGGEGREIFTAALKLAMELFPSQEIKIQAQCYLEKFYQSFGFKTITDPYPDVGIMHVDMIKAPV